MQSKYNWEDHEWKTRTDIIARLISPESRVLDMGGGKEHLKKLIDSPKSYHSVDRVKCTKDTILSDFNVNEYPTFNHVFDYVVAQGLIEYLKNPLDFITKASQYSNTLIITYLDTGSLEAKEKGRVTFISMRSFTRLLNKGGWKIVKRIKYTPNHHVFLCTCVEK